MGQYRTLEHAEAVWVLPDRAPALLTAWQQRDDGTWHGFISWSPLDPHHGLRLRRIDWCRADRLAPAASVDEWAAASRRPFRQPAWMPTPPSPFVPRVS